MEHDINLNIHYSIPKDLWEKTYNVFQNMPYWNEKENGWTGEDIDLWFSVEPSGIQIAGTMPEENFKFKYWKPFEKKYSDIKSIDNEFIIFNDYSMFDWEDFDTIKRNISAETPCFILKSEYIELRIYFDGSSKKINKRNFHDFDEKIKSFCLNHLVYLDK